MPKAKKENVSEKVSETKEEAKKESTKGKFYYKKVGTTFEVYEPSGALHRVYTKENHPTIKEDDVKLYVTKQNAKRHGLI